MASMMAQPDNAQQRLLPLLSQSEQEDYLGRSLWEPVRGRCDDWVDQACLDKVAGPALDDQTKQALMILMRNASPQHPEVDAKAIHEICLSANLFVTHTDKDTSPSIAQVGSETTPALPLTPTTTEDNDSTLHEFALEVVMLPPTDLKELFLSLAFFSRIPRTSLELLYNLTYLAKNQQFDDLMSTFKSAKHFFSLRFHNLVHQDFPRRDSMSQQGQLEPYQSFEENTDEEQYVRSSWRPFSPNLHDSSLQRTFGSLAPPSPELFPADNMFTVNDVSGILDNGGQLHDILPSPVTTRESSQSEGFPEANAPRGDEEASKTVVSCPIAVKNGAICGKICRGPHAVRSLQEHIRRLHPENHVAHQPATEANVKSTTDKEIAVCSIKKPDDTICGAQYTGTKRWRDIMQHLQEKHPDVYIPGIPANEANYLIMLSQPDAVICSLLNKQGKPCNKPCFGEKRWRSLQEHIRRAHHDDHIENLNATRESIAKICAAAGVPMPIERKAKAKVDGTQKKKPTIVEQPQQQASSPSEPLPQSTAAPMVQRQRVTAPVTTHPSAASIQQTYGSPYFPQQIQTSVLNTVAPAILDAEMCSPVAMTFDPGFHETHQQMLVNDQVFMSTVFPHDLSPAALSFQPLALGNSFAQSVATPTAQNLDQTLTPELFPGQVIVGQRDTMQAVHGDPRISGLGQPAQRAMPSMLYAGLSSPSYHALPQQSMQCPLLPESGSPYLAAPMEPLLTPQQAFSHQGSAKRRVSQTDGLSGQAPPNKRAKPAMNPSIQPVGVPIFQHEQ